MKLKDLQQELDENPDVELTVEAEDDEEEDEEGDLSDALSLLEETLALLKSLSGYRRITSIKRDEMVRLIADTESFLSEYDVEEGD